MFASLLNVHDLLCVPCSPGSSMPVLHFLRLIRTACLVQVWHFLNSTFSFLLILSLPPIVWLSARVRESDLHRSGWNGYRGVCTHTAREECYSGHCQNTVRYFLSTWGVNRD